MKITTPSAGISLLAIVIGSACLIIWNQNTIAQLVAKNESLSKARKEAERLSRENQQIPRLIATNAEVRKLREENHDLPKLRNEIHLLRERAKEFSLVRAEHERLRLLQNKPTPSNPVFVRPPGFIPLASFHDAGLGTPEATIRTAFWAMSQGNLERWSECTISGSKNLQEDRDWQRKNFEQEMKSFTGFQITGKKNISPIEVELQLQTVIGGTTLPVRMKLIGHEWKWDN